MKIIFSVISLILISKSIILANLIVEPVSASQAISDQSYGDLYVFNINFDITSINGDTTIRRGTNKGLLPPTSPEYDQMGFVWEYDIRSAGDLVFSTRNDFEYRADFEVTRDSDFIIPEGVTKHYGIAVTFTASSGSGIVGVNLIGGHTADGEFFPINMSSDKMFVSAVPEPSSILLILLGVLYLVYRKK
jgi:hypothetical protein